MSVPRYVDDFLVLGASEAAMQFPGPASSYYRDVISARMPCPGALHMASWSEVFKCRGR